MGSSTSKDGDIPDFINPFEGPNYDSNYRNISKTLKLFFTRNSCQFSLNKKLSCSFTYNKEESNKTYNKLLNQENSDDNNNLLLVELSKSTDENSSTSSDYKDITEEFLTISAISANRPPRYNKTLDMLRKDYYARLIYSQSWNPYKKEKQFKTLFVFDWDDTLFCSSFIFPGGTANNDKRITQRDMAQIVNLDNIVFSILSKSLDLGEVCIVTNASCGWVEFASNRFYKKSSELISKIKIVSARNKNEKTIPGIPKAWKVETFLQNFEEVKFFGILNLISVGDSIIEMEAAKKLSSTMRNCVLKTVKMQETPTLKDLIKQLELIDNKLDKIYSTARNMTIRVEKKKIEE